MECFVHSGRPANGVCSLCGRAMCRECVVSEPRLVCRVCAANPAMQGCEYRSEVEILGLPLIHVCSGVDPVTGRPRVARGIIAIGNIAIGGLAIGGVSMGLVTIGGLSVGIAGALGGAAVGLGLSLGGVAAGSIAVGGVALGLSHAIGGLALAPHAIGPARCDPETAALVSRWIGHAGLANACR